VVYTDEKKMNFKQFFKQMSYLMQQQLLISDLNPHAEEFISKDELWFQNKEKEFVWNNSWIFDDEEEEDKEDTLSEAPGASTPPVMLLDNELNDEENEKFYDCIII
jgi:hypothetical protein